MSDETNEVPWWYLSFADNGWLGFCIVQAANEITAILASKVQGINPGGEIIFFVMPVEPPEAFRNKLFTSKEDVARFDKAIGGEGEACSSVTGEVL